MSTSDESNLTMIRPNLFHIYKIQVQVKKEVHAKNMKQYDDDYDIYNYCELLNTKKWDNFINNLLNDNAKRDYLDDMTRRSKYTLSELSEEEKKT
jgi:hypothetical protein